MEALGNIFECKYTRVLVNVLHSSGRLHVISTPAKPELQTNSAAIALLSELLSHSGFYFVDSEPANIGNVWLAAGAVRTASPKIWMDTYLAAFARGHSLRLVTFDSAFEKLRRMGLDLLVLS